MESINHQTDIRVMGMSKETAAPVEKLVEKPMEKPVEK